MKVEAYCVSEFGLHALYSQIPMAKKGMNKYIFFTLIGLMLNAHSKFLKNKFAQIVRCNLHQLPPREKRSPSAPSGPLPSRRPPKEGSPTVTRLRWRSAVGQDPAVPRRRPRLAHWRPLRSRRTTKEQYTAAGRRRRMKARRSPLRLRQ